MKKLKAAARAFLIWVRLLKRPDVIATVVTSFPRQTGPEEGVIAIVEGGGVQKWASFRCPGGCGERIDLSLNKNRSPKWKIEMDFWERPTVTPSVRQLESCRCHFWIRKGAVDWCADSGRRR